MDNIITLYKKRGETPLEALEQLRVDQPSLATVALSYAGRLDPMAEGVMLVLVGDEANKDREKYLNLDKTYFFEILFGFKTDTADVLGKISDVDLLSAEKISESKLKKACIKMIGKKSQTYPAYSSRTVLGKPLFEWAREGRLDEIKIPEREVEIFDLAYLGSRKIVRADLLSEILNDIALVKGDFRQKEICALWKKELQSPSEMRSENHPTLTFASFRVSCSSGTYVRALAEDIARELGTVAIAYKIVREKVGDHSLVSDSAPASA